MRKVASGSVIWSGCLLATWLGLAVLWLKGDLVKFLDVVNWGTLGLSAGLLLLLFVVSLRCWSDQPGAAFSYSHLLFLIPLLLALTVHPSPISESVWQGDGILGVTMMTESGVDSRVPLPEGKLVIDQGNFLQMMEMLWSAGESIDGREVEMVGFVYNDPSLGQQDFILARLIITCCANDADIAGLLCRWPERQALDEGEWVKVQGKLGRVPYYNLQTHQITNMPFIQVEQLTEVQKPEQEYVYP